MSSFIVSDLHLSAVVDAIVDSFPDIPFREYYPYYYKGIKHSRTANEIGQILLNANYASVTARYGDNTFVPNFKRLKRSHYPALQYIKLIDSLEYQCSDAYTWEGSEAQHILHSARHKLLTNIPGYDQARWTI